MCLAVFLRGSQGALGCLQGEEWNGGGHADMAFLWAGHCHTGSHVLPQSALTIVLRGRHYYHSGLTGDKGTARLRNLLKELRGRIQTPCLPSTAHLSWGCGCIVKVGQTSQCVCYSLAHSRYSINGTYSTTLGGLWECREG